jgi:uncharacterized membrane protein
MIKNKFLEYFVAFMLLFVFYLVIDNIFIQLVTKKFFSPMIKNIQKTNMNVKILPSLFVFIVGAFGLTYFIYDKIRYEHIYLDSLKYAFVFGLVTYAIFDLTNMAIFNNWLIGPTLIDILWGGVVFFLSMIIVKNIMKKINK